MLRNLWKMTLQYLSIDELISWVRAALFRNRSQTIPAGASSPSNLTLKAFANFSPGLGFGNPGTEAPHFPRAQTLKGLRRDNSKPDQTGILSPGFQSKPWAGISQRLRR